MNSDAPSMQTFATCQNGRRIYVNERDERGRKLQESAGNVNPPALQLWRRLASEGWTHVVDVGANYGEMLVNVEWPSSTSLVAVEPNPALVPLLVRTMSDAGLHVSVVTNALGSKSTSAEFQANGTWSGLSRLGRTPHPESQGHEIENIEVQVVTLASLLDGDAASQKILLKVDVEGAECEVLRGMESVLNQLGSFACMIEVLHMSETDLGWLIENFQPEVFDPITGQLIPIHGDFRRLQAILGLGIFHYQDIVIRRRTDTQNYEANR